MCTLSKAVSSQSEMIAAQLNASMGWLMVGVAAPMGWLMVGVAISARPGLQSSRRRGRGTWALWRGLPELRHTFHTEAANVTLPSIRHSDPPTASDYGITLMCLSVTTNHTSRGFL